MVNRIAQTSFILCVALFTSIAAADTPEVTVINARLGVAKAPRFKAEYWAQLTVTIRNKGPQANAEVQYTPKSAGFARSTTLFRKAIVVPAQSEVEIAFPILTSFDEKFLIELFVNGTAVDKQEFSSSSVSVSDPLVVILDDGVTGYSYFKDLKIENRKVTLSIAQSGDLPSFWQVLDGVTMIVMGEIDMHRFQQAQIDTLDSWIRAGGILVVSTDERWEKLRGSFVEEWLPVRMYGARPIDSLAPLGERYGTPIAMHENLFFCEAMPASGDVLLTLQDLPLIAWHKRGLGAVVFAGVRLDSAPVGRWPGLSPMWEEIFTLRERPIEVRRTAFEAAREEMLSNITGLPVPRSAFVAQLLLAYLAAVAALFVIFRWRRHLEWAWIALLIVAPVAAGVYHTIGQAHRQEFRSTLNEISIVRMSGVPESHAAPPVRAGGWAESFHSLYSDREQTYHLRATDADVTIAQGAAPTESGGATIPSINVMAEDLIVADRMKVSEGGLQSFKTFTAREFPGGVVSKLAWGPGGLQGEIQNNLGFPLEDAMLLFNRQFLTLGTIPDGESRSMAIADGKNASFAPMTKLGASIEVTRKKILENLFTPAGNYNPAQDQPLLIAWSNQPVSEIADESGSLQKQGLTLYLVALPVQLKEGEILIPKGVCLARVQSALTFRNGQWVQMQGFASGSEVEIDFRIPPDARDIEVGSIRGRFEIENPGSDMSATIAAYDWSTGKWVDLGARNEFELADPWRFVVKPIGRVRLKLSVTAIRGKVPTGDQPSFRAFKWRVQDVDIEIRGKVS